VRRQRTETGARRTALAAEKKERESDLSRERESLAGQLRAAYMIGREEPLKLLLNQKDPELAEAALRALDTLWTLPKGNVQVTVRDGVVILEGKVDWKYQSDAAANAVRRLRGARDVRLQPGPPGGAVVRLDLRSVVERRHPVSGPVGTRGSATTARPAPR